MLPILVLVALCGFLAQDVQGNVGTQVSLTISPNLVQSVISKQVDKEAWKEQIMSLPLGDSLKNNKEHSGHTGGFLGINLFKTVGNVISSITGCKIKQVDLPMPLICLSEEKQEMQMKVPACLHLQINVPGTTMKVLDFKMQVVMIASIHSEKDPHTGRTRLVFKSCENTPGHLKIDFFDKKLPLLNAITSLVTSTFEKVVPPLLQNVICPFVIMILQFFIGILQGSLVPSAQDVYQMSADNFYITDNAMRIDYKGASQTTGGQTQVALPPSKPLPSLPLGDSSVKMLLDVNFLQNEVQSQLTSQTLNVAESEKVTKFQEDLRKNVNFPLASIVNIVKISSKVPIVALTSEKMNIEEKMEIQVSGQDNQKLFVIRIKAIFGVNPSVIGGKLIFLIQPKSIGEISLVESTVGALDVSSLKNVVLELVKNSFVPHANGLLSKGCKLPAVDNFDVDKFTLSYHPNFIELYSSEGATDIQYNNWEEIKWETP